MWKKRAVSTHDEKKTTTTKKFIEQFSAVNLWTVIWVRWSLKYMNVYVSSCECTNWYGVVQDIDGVEASWIEV